MAYYKILSTNNVIVADLEFVETHYPNDYELYDENKDREVIPPSANTA